MIDLETLKEIFRDKRTHIAIGKITQLSLADDRSFLKCLVSVFPEEREMVARMSWDSVGPDSGIFAFPAISDLVLIAFADGDPDMCFVINRLSSSVDKIPVKATEGHTVIKALSGKEAWVSSDTKINLSKGDSVPTQNIVLGQELKSLLSSVLDTLSTLASDMASHTHTYTDDGSPSTTGTASNAASFTSAASEFNSKKSSPVDDEAILSDLVFTEKGE